MAEVGVGTLAIEPDTRRIEAALRILAKHAAACADELALFRIQGPGDDDPVDGPAEEPQAG